jgi:hypothetical protein
MCSISFLKSLAHRFVLPLGSKMLVLASTSLLVHFSFFCLCSDYHGMLVLLLSISHRLDAAQQVEYQARVEEIIASVTDDAELRLSLCVRARSSSCDSSR